MRETKSGPLTMKYRRQIEKDLTILQRKLKFNNIPITKIEWHVFGDVDEFVLNFIQEQMVKRGIPKKSFTVIIH